MHVEDAAKTFRHSNLRINIFPVICHWNLATCQAWWPKHFGKLTKCIFNKVVIWARLFRTAGTTRQPLRVLLVSLSLEFYFFRWGNRWLVPVALTCRSCLVRSPPSPHAPRPHCCTSRNLIQENSFLRYLPLLSVWLCGWALWVVVRSHLSQ